MKTRSIHWVIPIIMIFSYLGSKPYSALSFDANQEDITSSSECVDCPKHIDPITDHSLRIDSQGYPHIVYGGRNLYHAWKTVTGWHYEIAGPATGAGQGAALALDSHGHAHISYVALTRIGSASHECAPVIPGRLFIKTRLQRRRYYCCLGTWFV